jgi:hypothetical protein
MSSSGGGCHYVPDMKKFTATKAASYRSPTEREAPQEKDEPNNAKKLNRNNV